jgi:hypothetical protein
MEPALNERSIEPSEMPTMERVTALLAVLRRLDALGFPRVLRQVRGALELEVEAGTTLRTWILRKAPHDTRQLLGRRLEKAPFVEELHGRQEDARGLLLQVTYDGELAIGAGIAYFCDAPAVALRGTPRWEVDPLIVLLTTMDEERDQLVEGPVEVVHLCRSEQVDARQQLLRERVLHALSGGDELWRRRLELYPRLDFCEKLERQLRDLSGKELHFQHVVLALSRLDAALAGWTVGSLYPGMDSSGESTQTLEHGTYGPMREFICPDGRKRQFSNHLKLRSSNWRIYYWEFRDEAKNGRALIGYVGTHLPTVKYST